jgi:AcrR family transcriptional regulator
MAAPLNRQSVIDAARDCIVADGLEAISLRKLAAALGVTAPALYAYVDDKRDLLRGVAELEFRRLSARFEQIDDADPVERMRQMSHAYVEQALAEPELFRTMFQFSPDLAIGGTTGAEDELATSVFELALSSVVQAIDSGALRPAEPLTVALIMWSATHGVVDMLLMGFPFDDATRELLVDSVIDTVLAGLATQPNR